MVKKSRNTLLADWMQWHELSQKAPGAIKEFQESIDAAFPVLKKEPTANFAEGFYYLYQLRFDACAEEAEAASFLIEACLNYVQNNFKKNKRTFSTVETLLRLASSDYKAGTGELDFLFDNWKQKGGDCMAWRNYLSRRRAEKANVAERLLLLFAPHSPMEREIHQEARYRQFGITDA